MAESQQVNHLLQAPDHSQKQTDERKPCNMVDGNQKLKGLDGRTQLESNPLRNVQDRRI
jgi:hypothetical protein